jgi:uncharacterized protein (DUF302 family)
MAGDMADVEADVRAALAAEGFGVLTEIDGAATLRAKLGVVDHHPLKILGVCNPSFSHRALGLDPSLSLVLPCNVVIEDVGAGRSSVAIADPRTMLADRDSTRPELDILTDEAGAALERALARIGR